MARRYQPRSMSVGEARHVMTLDMSEVEEAGWDGTIQHAKNMARMAASRLNFRGAGFSDLADEALSGVMMHLAERPDSSVHDCIDAGARAASARMSQIMRGKRTDGKNTGQRYEMYWHAQLVQIDDYHLDAMALAQVWERLSEDSRRMLTLAALHDTLIDAAKHEGVHVGTMRAKVRAARLRALTLWHDWETPPKPSMAGRKRLKTHCNHGHPFTAENTQWITDTKGNRQRRCATCNRQAQQKVRDKKLCNM